MPEGCWELEASCARARMHAHTWPLTLYGLIASPACLLELSNDLFYPLTQQGGLNIFIPKNYKFSKFSKDLCFKICKYLLQHDFKE